VIQEILYLWAVKTTIQSLSIVGFGNVGSHLAEEFNRQGIQVSHIYTRREEIVRELTSAYRPTLVENLRDLPKDQLVILCVPDAIIGELLLEIPANCPVAYTSGSTEIDSLPKRDRLGVFYPLQTFSQGVPVNLFEVPFFIESKNSDFALALFDLAWKISHKVTYASSEERKHLHLAAVWVNNFTNHMNHIAHSYLDSKGLDYDHLKPLLSETAKKLQTASAYDAQTGPARRNDLLTIESHLSELSGDQREMYRLISKSIQDTYSND
jgi:predicted short-subunit dehydrogenase-like oxidoreductase (DUF2520 family)